jgi:probable H4MPT-linked C1 transfer pathway protein
MTKGPVLGLDVGGAGIKGAIIDRAGQVAWVDARRFALWREPDKLADELQSLVRNQRFDRIALTMTGELCDAFQTKEEGVTRIVHSVIRAFVGVPVKIWQAMGRFVDAEDAIADAWGTAAGNWLALAEYVAEILPKGEWILVDVGSTTTDVIPIRDGQVIARGRSDPDRLAARELVYRGVRRTPVAAVLKDATIDGVHYPLMAELFATTLDAYLVLEKISENPNENETADGRAETFDRAIDRLSRMIGSDRTRFGKSQATELAKQVWREQQRETLDAMKHVAAASRFSDRCGIVTSGEGEWLVRSLSEAFPLANFVSLGEVGSPALSRGACAWGVARLLWRDFARGS